MDNAKERLPTWSSITNKKRYYQEATVVHTTYAWVACVQAWHSLKAVHQHILQNYCCVQFSMLCPPPTKPLQQKQLDTQRSAHPAAQFV